MEAEIASVRKNPLLGRRDVEIEIDHEGEPTPSEEDVKNRMAAENDIEVEKIEVKSIKTGYGSNTSHAILKVSEEFDYDEDLEENPEDDQRAEKETESETAEDQETEGDYEEIVSGTITDAKDALNEMEEPDYEKALEAEKDNKDRKTLKEWLEKKIE